MSIRTPQQQHDLEHDDPTVSLGSCGQCTAERRRCSQKARFLDRDRANTRGQEINISTDWTLRLVAYPCPWCQGFHLTKAKPGTSRWKVAEKRRREWLRTRSTVHPLLLTAARVVESPYIPDGEVHELDDLPGTVVVGTRALTDLEYAAAEARWLVRDGLADVLAWLGEPVGPEPVRAGRGRELLRQHREAS